MTGNASPESRMMTEPKEIKLFDLKTDKRYDITAISKSDDVGPTNGLFFILEGNLKLYLSVVDLFSDSTKINLYELYELYDAVSYFLDKKQIVFLQRNHMIFNSSDCEDCFCTIIISEDLPI
jgi:hypothetical protein